MLLKLLQMFSLSHGSLNERVRDSLQNRVSLGDCLQAPDHRPHMPPLFWLLSFLRSGFNFMTA